MNLKEKTILLTGGSSGIGHALSALLVDAGATVINFDLKEPAEPVDGVTTISVDVTNADQIQKGLEEVDSEIDVLINNAGLMRRGTLLDSTEEEFDLLFDVSVKGSWLMLKYTQPKLKENATVVQMASRYALDLPTDPALYGLSKMMQKHLAEIFEETYPQYDVKVLFPGPVDTPLARYEVKGEALEAKEKIMESPEEIAELIVQLLEEDKKRLVYENEQNTYALE